MLVPADGRLRVLDFGLAKVLAIDPGNAKALYNRGEIFAGIPPLDLPAAEKELRRALDAAPGYRRAQELLDQVRARIASGSGGGGPPR